MRPASSRVILGALSLVSAVLAGAGALPAIASEGAAPGGFDSSLWFGSRSVPIAAALAAQGGYNQVLWGDPAQGPLHYGFIRPGGRVQSSAVVSMAEARLGIYPISFAGVNLGAGTSYRAFAFTKLVDCNELACTGFVNNYYVQPRVALKFGPVAAVINYKIQQLASADGSRAFFDEKNSLWGAKGGDRTTELEAFLGTEVGEARQAGLLLSDIRFAESKSHSSFLAGVYRFKAGEARDWSIALGAGAYRSTLIPTTPMVLGVVQWTLDPGLEIF